MYLTPMEWGNYRNRPHTIQNGTEYYNNTSWILASQNVNKIVNNTFCTKNRSIYKYKNK